MHRAAGHQPQRRSGARGVARLEAPLTLAGPLFQRNGACPYLPDKEWAAMYLVSFRSLPAHIETVELTEETFARLLSIGYRRSGRALYTPRCGHCQECVSIRLLVKNFQPTGDQRRALRKNPDVELRIGYPEFTDEKLALYSKFLAARYPREHMPEERPESFKSFFVDNFGNTREFRYYLADRLVGVGIVDVVPNAASSVYFYFDPDESERSLGTYSLLREIQFCKETDREHLYLGFRVAGCKAMAYKANYRPHELLHPVLGWVAEAEFDKKP